MGRHPLPVLGYRIVADLLFILLSPALLLYLLFRPRDNLGLRQRLGRIAPALRRGSRKQPPRIWLHAASVGEVAAAGVLIRELLAGGRPLDIVLSTMTVQGQRVARDQLVGKAHCFLAPLDFPWIVRRVVSQVLPDIYVCLETELWPAMLEELRRRGIATVMLNGRLSDRSFRRYRQAGGLFRPLLQDFRAVAAISAEDGTRFVELGVVPVRIQVTGNIKFDFSFENSSAQRRLHRNRLGVDRETVFICGSTRSGEERLLAGVYQSLAAGTGRDLVWVIAPRHLRRLTEVKALLVELGLGYDLYSALGSGQRQHQVVLVDSLGDLASLYSAGDINFVGGSLVAKGGHNLMEAVRWGRPVYYGPHVDDFRDAAHILEQAGAGFRIDNAVQLTELLAGHLADEAVYGRACTAAASVVDRQQGTAARQAAIVINMLAGDGNNEQDNEKI